jgi:hypothetical protein
MDDVGAAFGGEAGDFLLLGRRKLRGAKSANLPTYLRPPDDAPAGWQSSPPPSPAGH